MTPLDRISQLTDENAQLRAALARVTAEREEMKQERDTAEMFAKSALDNGDLLKAEVVTIRARVADLEADASLHWITEEELRQSRARVADYESRLSAVMPADFKDWHENARSEWPEVVAWCIANIRNRADAAEARVAELVAALEALLALHDPDGKFEPHGNKPALAQARAILARSETAAPAKHPDTERLDWLEAQPSKYEWAVTLDHGCVFVTRNKTSGRPSIRAAIDQARAAK